MAGRSDDELRRELAFYRRQCDDLGARVLRLQEEQSRAHREALRSRTTAKLIREAYGLVDINASIDMVGQRMLAIVLENVLCDRAALLSHQPERGTFVVDHALGFGGETVPSGLTLASPPTFYFTTAQTTGESPAPELRALIGVPYLLWSFDPVSGMALILGNRSEANVARPFEPDDRQVAEGALSVYVDIVARARTEADLRRAKVLAEEAGTTRSSFLANLSHELRTPLNAILGFSEIIRDEAFGPVGVERYKDYAAGIHASGDHLMSLINDILDYSRLEAGKALLLEEVVDLRETASVAVMTVTAAADAGGVGLAVEIGEDVPPLFADTRRIRQILINLLANSVKFTPRDGQVTLRAGMDAGGGVRIQVIDTGIGIAAADLAKVMEPFGQVESIYSRRHPGSGLGLPIAKALVERHEGRLDIESVPGKGTTVSVRFPAHRVIRAGSTAEG